MNKAEKFWDKQADNFDPQDGDYGETFAKSLDLTKPHLKKDDVVMDYACGTGRMSIAVADFVQEIEGIDISSKMIEIAQNKANQQELDNVTFAHATIFDEQLLSESFDVVLAFNILHLLDDAPNVVQQIHGLLKPGGLFISATACLGEYGLLAVFLRLVSKLGVVPYINKLNSSQVEALMTERGFQIIETAVLSSSPTEYFVVAKKR